MGEWSEVDGLVDGRPGSGWADKLVDVVSKNWEGEV